MQRGAVSFSPIVSIEYILYLFQDNEENDLDPSSGLESSFSIFRLASSSDSFFVFASSFAEENTTIERLEDDSNVFSSFIESKLSRFYIEEFCTPTHLKEDSNLVFTSSLVLWITSIALLTRMILLHLTFDGIKESSSIQFQLSFKILHHRIKYFKVFSREL